MNFHLSSIFAIVFNPDITPLNIFFIFFIKGNVENFLNKNIIIANNSVMLKMTRIHFRTEKSKKEEIEFEMGEKIFSDKNSPKTPTLEKKT